MPCHGGESGRTPPPTPVKGLPRNSLVVASSRAAKATCCWAADPPPILWPTCWLARHANLESTTALWLSERNETLRLCRCVPNSMPAAHAAAALASGNTGAHGANRSVVKRIESYPKPPRLMLVEPEAPLDSSSCPAQPVWHRTRARWSAWACLPRACPHGAPPPRHAAAAASALAALLLTTSSPHRALLRGLGPSSGQRGGGSAQPS